MNLNNQNKNTIQPLRIEEKLNQNNIQLRGNNVQNNNSLQLNEIVGLLDQNNAQLNQNEVPLNQNTSQFHRNNIPQSNNQLSLLNNNLTSNNIAQPENNPFTNVIRPLNNHPVSENNPSINNNIRLNHNRPFINNPPPLSNIPPSNNNLMQNNPESRNIIQMPLPNNNIPLNNNFLNNPINNNRIPPNNNNFLNNNNINRINQIPIGPPPILNIPNPMINNQPPGIIRNEPNTYSFSAGIYSQGFPNNLNRFPRYGRSRSPFSFNRRHFPFRNQFSQFNPIPPPPPPGFFGPELRPFGNPFLNPFPGIFPHHNYIANHGIYDNYPRFIPPHFFPNPHFRPPFRHNHQQIKENLEDVEVTEEFLNKNKVKECSICLERYNKGEKICYLPCFHFFHSECIKKWIDNSDKCPLCNNIIKIE